MDVELGRQHGRGLVDGLVIAFRVRLDQVHRQGILGGAQGPDMQVMGRLHAGQGSRCSRTAAGSIPLGMASSARLIDSFSNCQVPRKITAAITRLITGSIQAWSVNISIVPEITTPTDTAVSAAICRKAPRMFRSPF